MHTENKLPLQQNNQVKPPDHKVEKAHKSNIGKGIKKCPACKFACNNLEDLFKHLKEAPQMKMEHNFIFKKLSNAGFDPTGANKNSTNPPINQVTATSKSSTNPPIHPAAPVKEPENK